MLFCQFFMTTYRRLRFCRWFKPIGIHKSEILIYQANLLFKYKIILTLPRFIKISYRIFIILTSRSWLILVGFRRWVFQAGGFRQFLKNIPGSPRKNPPAWKFHPSLKNRRGEHFSRGWIFGGGGGDFSSGLGSQKYIKIGASTIQSWGSVIFSSLILL